MGWVWRSDDDSDYNSSSAGDFGVFGGSDADGGRCATRKVVSSQCRTEEVEPGKFIRKCEKTEQIFKDCVGRPSEMVQSNKEITEEDVTNQMTRGAFPFGSAEDGEGASSYFPGLRNDIEAIERSLFGGFDRFLQAADEMKKEMFHSIRGPHSHRYEYDTPPMQNRRGIPIESRGRGPAEDDASDGTVDLSGLARDV